jgi:hypothetical protein
MSTGDLPPWPSEKDYTFAPVWTDGAGITHQEDEYFDQGLYNCARAEAAIARLRKAVEALREVQTHHYAEDMDLVAREALSLIGELPKERT